MILATTDPATMAPRERVRELGKILASGYLRARAADTARLGADLADVAPGAPRNASRKALAGAANQEPSSVPTPTARDSRDAAAHGEHR